MGEVLGSLLPHAFGISLSPIPIMGFLLMLTSTGGRAKAWSFIAGAYICLFGLAVITSMVASAPEDIDENNSDASNSAAWIRIGLGLLLFFFAYRQWKKLPGEGEVAEVPGWMKAIDKMSAVQAFGMGALLMGPKPKNLIIIIGASLNVAEAGLRTSTQWITNAIFILLALWILILLALMPLLLGHRGDKLLTQVSTVLGRYNGVVMLVIFMAIGVVFLGNGISALFD